MVRPATASRALTFRLCVDSMPDYTTSRLNGYRDGEVNGDEEFVQPNHGRKVAEPMTDEEINAVSSYIEGLHMARWQEASGN